MAKFSSVAHVLAAILATVSAFLMTPAGQALVHQYPAIAPVATLVAIAAIYFSPKKAAQ